MSKYLSKEFRVTEKQVMLYLEFILVHCCFLLFICICLQLTIKSGVFIEH